MAEFILPDTISHISSAGLLPGAISVLSQLTGHPIGHAKSYTDLFLRLPVLNEMDNILDGLEGLISIAPGTQEFTHQQLRDIMVAVAGNNVYSVAMQGLAANSFN